MAAAATHVLLSNSHRNVLHGAKLLGALHQEEHVEVLLKLRRKATLPDCHFKAAPLSRAEIADKYGAENGDVELVKTTLAKFGVEVTSANQATRTVHAAGTADAVQKAFQVHLFNYFHEVHGRYRGHCGRCHLPAALDKVVLSVHGLDNRRVVKRRPHPPRTSRMLTAHALADSTRPWFFPAELAKIYDFPEGTGAGESIGVLEFGGGYFDSDLKQFLKDANVQKQPQVVPISVDGTRVNVDDEATGEVMLDVEVIAGVCPDVRIAVYFAGVTEQAWVEAIDAALQDKQNEPTLLSISWGGPEEGWSSGGMEAVNEALHEAAVRGITVLVASGDDGSGDTLDDGPAHVDFPSSSPFSLVVGGTMLRRNKQAGATDDKWIETTWKDGSGIRPNGGSTGGGVSNVFARPDWQKTATSAINSVNPDSINGRVIPDVATNASAITGYWTVSSGSGGVSGGTSASAPLFAALLALINAQRVKAGKRRVGYMTPALYASFASGTVGSEGCKDIIKGDNVTAGAGGYFATKGFDAVTGWGSPKGKALAAALDAALSPP